MDKRYIAIGAVSLILGILVSLAAPLYHYIQRPGYLATTPLVSITAPPLQETREGLAGGLSFRDYRDLRDHILRSLETTAVSSLVALGTVPARSPWIMPLTETAWTPVSTTSAREVSEHSKTNVQVEGVDEADIVKNSERAVFVLLDVCCRFDEARVYVYDDKVGDIVSVIRIRGGEFPIVRPIGLYLYRDRLVVITESLPAIAPPEIRPLPLPAIIQPLNRSVRVSVFDVRDLSRPVLVTSYNISGRYISSRLLDHYLYLITEMPAVDIARQEKVLLPSVNGVFLRPQDIVALSNISLIYTQLVAIDLESLTWRSVAYLTEPSTRIYMSRERLYIATETPVLLDMMSSVARRVLGFLSTQVSRETIEKMVVSLLRGEYREAVMTLYNITDNGALIDNLYTILREAVPRESLYRDTTRFYVYRVRGLDIVFQGSFVVEGSLLDQFSMEEFRERYFVVATTRESLLVRTQIINYTVPIIVVYHPPNLTIGIGIIVDRTKLRELSVPVIVPEVIETNTSNNVYVIDLENLSIVGSLQGLAEGERIYAARLVGSVLYLVTFRRVDPLFAIDLSDPDRPRVVGYIKTPGYSEYLHPISSTVLLSIGVETGLKISLVDVSDPTSMREISVVRTECISTALYDHHAVTIYSSRKLFILPVLCKTREGFMIFSYDNYNLSIKDFIDQRMPLRSVYIDNRLMTISVHEIIVYNLDTGHVVREIHFEKTAG